MQYVMARKQSRYNYRGIDPDRSDLPRRCQTGQKPEKREIILWMQLRTLCYGWIVSQTIEQITHNARGDERNIVSPIFHSASGSGIE